MRDEDTTREHVVLLAIAGNATELDTTKRENRHLQDKH